MATSLYIGLDAGGSKTDILIERGGEQRHGCGPPAHAIRDGGPDAAAESLKRLLDDTLGDWASVPIEGLCAGFAGAGRRETREAIAGALRSRLGGAPVHVVHDAKVALAAAFEEGTGAILIVGTGSIFFSRDKNGKTYRSGGWGWRLGDPGSGDALGKDVLRAALADYDGGPSTALTERLREEGMASTEEILSAIYENGLRPSGLAPLLLRAVENGDWVAQKYLTEEANALAEQAERLIHHAGDALPHRLAFTGGLSKEPTYRKALRTALERRLPGWSFIRSEVPPVEGALRLARRIRAC